MLLATTKGSQSVTSSGEEPKIYGCTAPQCFRASCEPGKEHTWAERLFCVVPETGILFALLVYIVISDPPTSQGISTPADRQGRPEFAIRLVPTHVLNFTFPTSSGKKVVKSETPRSGKKVVKKW